jgi:hypothetical protein
LGVDILCAAIDNVSNINVHTRNNDMTNQLDNAEVGDGATYTIFSDSQAGTIIKRTPKSITWQRDKAALLNSPKSGEEDALVCTPGGFAGHTSGIQRHSYERDTEGRVIKFTRREVHNKYTGETKVYWVQSGHPTRSPGCSLTDGRHEHYDFNF